MKLSLPVIGPPTPAALARQIEALLEGPVDDERARALHALAVELFALPNAEAHYAAVASAFAAAAAAGLPEAWLELGRCRWNGWGTPEDRELALAAYKRSAALGSAEGAFVTAANLFFAFERDEEALAYAREALAGGDEGGDVHHLLALIASSGRSLPRDEAEAKRLHELAAGRGSTDAMLSLAGILETSDPHASIRWLEEAGRNGEVRAVYRLGVAYARGLGVPKDLDKSAQLYALASEAGYAQASLAIALMYRRGDGLTVDHDRADHFLARAQEQGLDVEAFLRSIGA